MGIEEEMGRTVITNGMVVCPDGVRVRDLLVEGETIAAIGAALGSSGATVIDATGCYVLPGGIDVHTHLELDTGAAVAQDDFYTGTVAAAVGGTTTIVDHPGFGPKGCSLFHQLELYHQKARGKAVIDYSFHGTMQHLDERIALDFSRLSAAGVTSVKGYLTYQHGLSDSELLELFRLAKAHNILVALHAEDDRIVQQLRQTFIGENKREPIYHARSRPVQAEVEAIRRIISLAREADWPGIYIVHLSSGAALELVLECRKSGEPLFAETCPQYLLLGEELYHQPDEEGLKYVMSPPLRNKADQDALWQGIVGCSGIDVIATDHCPFDFSLKKELSGGDFSRCPGGAPGVESRMSLLFSEGVAKRGLDLVSFARLTAENPAKLMGLYPQKGVLAKGSDADIILVDPQRKYRLTHSRLHENVDYTPYEGMDVCGEIALTMLRGQVIARDGTFTGRAGNGKFIHRKQWSRP